MTRRSWMLAVAMLSFTAGGVWAGLALANARSTKSGDCCIDPTCPPGCSEDCPPCCSLDCPPDCFTGAKASVQAKDMKAVDCCDDPTCPPGCSPACPPDCLDLTAKANTKTAAKSSCCSDGECCATGTARSTKTSVTKKYICPPCPFCPGW